MENVKLEKMHMDQMVPLIEDAVNNGRNFLLCPKGTSMLPTISSEKDYVLLKAPENLKKYDIVLYKRTGGQFVLHRILGIKNGKYTMCGDNQYFRERGIEQNQIIAKVFAIHKNGGEKIIEINNSGNIIYAFFLRLILLPKHMLLSLRRRIIKLFKRK